MFSLNDQVIEHLIKKYFNWTKKLNYKVWKDVISEIINLYVEGYIFKQSILVFNLANCIFMNQTEIIDITDRYTAGPVF